MARKNQSSNVSILRCCLKAMSALSLIYGVVAVMLINVLGDRWWLGTVAMFAPRWALLLPVLLGFAGWPWLNRKFRLLQLGGSLLIGWMVLGICIPWRSWLASPDESYRLLTCNVAYWSGGSARIQNLVKESQVDILVLQEFSRKGAFALPADWHSHQDGELFIASRFPLQEIKIVRRDLKGRWPRAIGMLFEIKTPRQPMALCTVHLLSPRYGLTEMLNTKTGVNLSRSAKLEEETDKRLLESRHTSDELSEHTKPLVVAGDFNTPVESWIMRHHWPDFRNAFSEAGWGIGNTVKFQKRGLEFRARIDHVLTRGNWRAASCWVGPDVGSDHFPVIADLYWQQ